MAPETRDATWRDAGLGSAPANHDQYRAMAETRIRFSMPPVVVALVAAAKGACRCRSTYSYSTPRSIALNGLHMKLIVPDASDELVDEQVPVALDQPERLGTEHFRYRAEAQL